MKAITNKRIAIVGGGPGGLTLARLLQQSGAAIKVYERDVNKDVRVQGATLDLHDDTGLRALRHAGLIEAFKANYRPGADRTCIVDKDATIRLDEHVNKAEEFSRPEIDRGPLRKILLESLEPDTVVWNSYLVSLSKLGEAWKLEFQNGESAVADLVIGADGANSKIRPFITPGRPFFAGVTAIEGTVYHAETAAPAIYKLLGGGKIFALDEEKTLIVSAKGDGSLSFYAGYKTDEDWVRASGIDFSDRGQVLGWFKQEFASWNEIWLELFEQAALPLIPRPQYCMPLDQRWDTLPNLTMLGDAAHLMPPYAGEGVNMAMLDALELSICLTDERLADTRAAIARYEERMLARFAEVAAMTLEQTASLHSSHALSDMLALFGQ